MINVIPKKIDIRICPQWQIMKFYLFWRLYYSEMLSLMPNGWHQLPRRVASSFFGECDIVQTSSKHNKIKYWLVVLTILKTMKVNGKDYPIHYGKKMFQTTNQIKRSNRFGSSLDTVLHFMNWFTSSKVSSLAPWVCDTDPTIKFSE